MDNHLTSFLLRKAILALLWGFCSQKYMLLSNNESMFLLSTNICVFVVLGLQELQVWDSLWITTSLWDYSLVLALFSKQLIKRALRCRPIV